MGTSLTILFTRMLEESLKNDILANGIQIIDYSFLDIKYEISDDNILKINSNVAPIVFTSQHALYSLISYVESKKLVLKSNDIYCINGETKKVALNNGFSILGDAENALHLSKVIIQDKNKKILFLSGNIKRDDLINNLLKHSIDIQDVVVYQKTLLPIKIYQTFNAIAFFSPSQIDAFLSKNYLEKECPAFCIGNTTAKHLGQIGHKNIIVSKQNSTESVLQSIYNYFN